MFEEAELIVGVSGTVCRYLARKIKAEKLHYPTEQSDSDFRSDNTLDCGAPEN